MSKETAMVPAAPLDASALIHKANGSKPEDRIKQGYSVELQHTLQEGEELEGIYMGAGGKVEFVNPKTGEVSSVGTWRVRDASGNVIVNLLGSATLDARLGALKEGTQVCIRHMGQERTRKGMLANKYLIFTKAP